MRRGLFKIFLRNINFVSSVGYAFALSRVEMGVLSKVMVSFHLLVKLKASWKYININILNF